MSEKVNEALKRNLPTDTKSLSGGSRTPFRILAGPFCGSKHE